MSTDEGAADEVGTDRPLVSVVVTTRDRSALVGRAIESVLRLEAQTAFDLQVIVVDDGSVDDTPDVLGRLPVLAVRTTGVGMPGARNIGLHEARGEFVLFMDDDDELLPSAIVSQLAELHRHPAYGAVFGRAQRTDQALVPFGEPFPDADASSGWIFEDLLGYQPQIATMLVRRRVAAQLGGFNVRYDGDEWDFYLRLARRWPLGRIPDAVIMFRQREGAEEEQQWRRARFVREVFRVNTSHLRWTDRLRLRPVLSRVRGLHCYTFSRYAVENLRDRRYRRAFKSVWYAVRWSPVHAPRNLYREIRAPTGVSP